MYAIPCDTHRRLLGPLTNRRHIKYRLLAKDFKFYIPLKACDYQ